MLLQSNEMVIQGLNSRKSPRVVHKIKLGLSLKINENPDFGINPEVVLTFLSAIPGLTGLFGLGQTDLGGCKSILKILTTLLHRVMKSWNST